MNVENNTIKDWRNQYLNNFLPAKKQALENINTQHTEIMTGLIKAMQTAIPSGKWATFFEQQFDFSLPWEEKSSKKNEVKGSIYRMLYDRMPRGAGICLCPVEKEEILAAGFTSWDDFIASLAELNTALGDICGFYYLKGEEISADTSHIQLAFETTLA
jgi:hypothetical protein